MSQITLIISIKRNLLKAHWKRFRRTEGERLWPNPYYLVSYENPIPQYRTTMFIEVQ